MIPASSGSIEKARKALVLFLFLTLTTNLIITTVSTAMTFDEPLHIAAGYTKLTGDFRMNTEQPVLSHYLLGLAVSIARPTVDYTHQSWTEKQMIAFSKRFFFTDNNNPQTLLLLGRIPSILLTVLLALVVYLFALHLSGKTGSLIALTLYIFEPNIIAHGSLATTDIPFTFFFVLTTVLFLRHLTKGNFWAFSLSFALLQLTKYTAILFAPAFILILSVHHLWKKKYHQLLKELTLLALVSWLVICLAYGFQGVGIPLGKAMNLDPHLAQEYTPEKLLPAPLASFPNPLPYHYVKGLGFVFQEGKTPALNKLLSLYSETGFKNYFLVALGVKTTLGLLGLLLFSLGYTIYTRKITLAQTLLLLFGFFLLALFSFSTKQIGVRYILPFIPLMILFISSIHFKKTTIINTLIAFLLFTHIASGMTSLPQPLSYYNEVVGAENGWNLFADSNTDWGQDVDKLITYMHNNTADTISVLTTQDLRFYNITQPPTPETCTSGKHIVSAYHLFINGPTWLQKYKPQERIGTSIFVYVINKCS